MKFGIVQKEKFAALDGAYSFVTPREYDDSQITATDAETQLLEAAFGKENIWVGNVASNRVQARKAFRLYPQGKRIYLNLIYPKPKKTELRLYLSKTAGFKPNPGEVWFLFLRQGEIWIGAMKEAEWRKENAFYKDDVLLEEANEELESIGVTATAIANQLRYIRDPRVAKKRMEISKYKCEFNTTHRLFISRYTGVPFLESHHLIPMSFQSHFPKRRLDVVANVFCLCPYCHRAIHHADETEARGILTRLSEQRSVLRDYNMTLEDLYRLYSIEEISR